MDSILYKSDDTSEPYYPETHKFSEDELKRAVGGPFYIVTSDERDKFFIVNEKNNTETLRYNINANYLYRRKMTDGKVLKGNVLMCSPEYIDEQLLHIYSGKTM